MMVLIDVRVTDTHASSYVDRSLEAVIASAQTEKRQKYLEGTEAHRASFTPLVQSVDCAFGREAQFPLRRLAESSPIHGTNHTQW